MSQKTKEDYNKITLLLSFLEDNDPTIMADVQTQLKALAPESLPVLREILYDIENDNLKPIILEVISALEFKEYEQQIFKCFNTKQDFFIPLDILAAADKRKQTRTSKFNIKHCGFDVFMDINYEATPPEVLELLSSCIASYLKHSQYLHTDTVEFIRKYLPPWIASDYVCAIPYLAVSENFDIPLVTLKTDENFVLALKNSGDYTIGFIEDPFLAVLLPDEDGSADIMPFSEAINTSLLKDIDEMDYKELFVLFIQKIINYSNNKKDVFIQWLYELESKLKKY